MCCLVGHIQEQGGVRVVLHMVPDYGLCSVRIQCAGVDSSGGVVHLLAIMEVISLSYMVVIIYVCHLPDDGQDLVALALTTYW